MNTSMSYTDIIKSVFEERKSYNASYSLRAFANDLDLRPSHLSDILNKKKGLSLKSAEKVGQKLGLSQDEFDFFLNMALSENARSKEMRRESLKRLQSIKKHYDKTKLSDETLKVISDWYHFALVELIQIPGIDTSAENLARELDISIKESKEAINRLLKLRLIAKGENGKLCYTGVQLTTDTDIPSRAIKKFHAQVINKSLESLRNDPVEERDFSSLIISIPENEIKNLKGKITEFRREINTYIETIKEYKDVTGTFCLSIQLFKLNKGDTENEN